jgi:hypothetical protein
MKTPFQFYTSVWKACGCVLPLTGCHLCGMGTVCVACNASNDWVFQLVEGQHTCFPVCCPVGASRQRDQDAQVIGHMGSAHSQLCLHCLHSYIAVSFIIYAIKCRK